MAWDDKKHWSYNGYFEHIKEVAHHTVAPTGCRLPLVDGIEYFPLWWIRMEVRVFWEPSIPRQTAEFITGIVNEQMSKFGLKEFDFKMFGSHSSAMEQIAQATVNGQVDEQKLVDLGLTEHWRDESRGGRQHADIWITDKPFINDTVSWGAACFAHGGMVFALHGQRPHNRNFLRNVAIHETNHLLGMYMHCDNYQNVEGFDYDRKCNMHYSCPSDKLCEKCRALILMWWTQVFKEHELFMQQV